MKIFLHNNELLHDSRLKIDEKTTIDPIDAIEKETQSHLVRGEIRRTN